jgi:tripartite-type tricarboxylate transporter receptor subunit TctC
MKLARRTLLHFAAAAASLPAISRKATADGYPSRAVHLIVGLAPGGGTDIVARLMGQWLSQRLGQQFVIENRPGAGTNVATEAVVRAPPDGYTLLMVIGTSAINATLYENLNFNFIRDIAPVASLVSVPYILEVNPSVHAKTVPEFIAYVKANPGKLSFGSSGSGSLQHVAAELFKMMAGVDMVHVPYRGPALALNDLLGGQIQVMFDSVLGSIEQIRVGKLRALAVTTAERLDVLPDVPTVRQFLPGYEATGWQGVGAPGGTPAGIVDTLNSEINAALTDPTIKAKLAGLGGVPTPMTPAEFGQFIADETRKWSQVIKFADIKLD